MLELLLVTVFSLVFAVAFIADLIFFSSCCIAVVEDDLESEGLLRELRQK